MTLILVYLKTTNTILSSELYGLLHIFNKPNLKNPEKGDLFDNKPPIKIIRFKLKMVGKNMQTHAPHSPYRNLIANLRH